jgi:peptidoglycan hydrolase FlgJ
MTFPLAGLAAGSAVTLGQNLIQSLGQALDPKAASEAKARKTAEDFEAMFLEQSLNRVMESKDTDGPLGENGVGGDVYRSMLVKEYAGSITKSGGVGIADQVYAEILKMQEASHAR